MPASVGKIQFMFVIKTTKYITFVIKTYLRHFALKGWLCKQFKTFNTNIYKNKKKKVLVLLKLNFHISWKSINKHNIRPCQHGKPNIKLKRYVRSLVWNYSVILCFFFLLIFVVLFIFYFSSVAQTLKVFPLPVATMHSAWSVQS